MKKIYLLFFLIGFSVISYSQTVYVQGTDWVGNRYIVAYPINTNLNSFNARYDRAGINHYYVPPKQYTNTTIIKKKTTNNNRRPNPNPSAINIYNFEFKPDPGWYGNMEGLRHKD